MTDLLEHPQVREAFDALESARAYVADCGNGLDEVVAAKSALVAAITSAHLRQLVGTPDGMEQALSAMEVVVHSNPSSLLSRETQRLQLEAAAPHLLAPVAAKLAETTERLARAAIAGQEETERVFDLKARLQEAEKANKALQDRADLALYFSRSALWCRIPELIPRPGSMGGTFFDAVEYLRERFPGDYPLAASSKEGV